MKKKIDKVTINEKREENTTQEMYIYNLDWALDNMYEIKRLLLEMGNLYRFGKIQYGESLFEQKRVEIIKRLRMSTNALYLNIFNKR